MSETASTTHSKFSSPTIRRFRVRRRIAKIDRDWDAVANGKLDRVQVVAQVLIQVQNALTRRFAEFPSALSIPFDSGDDKGDAARNA